MNQGKIKRIGSIAFIVMGAIILVIEIASRNKNYYLQSAGVVLLMLGLFVINSKLTSKSKVDSQEYFEEE
ncbi:hypothetical protein [Aquimarina celericrescens]|uniref:Gliding motility protein GldL n=1 Tax=Aquimarina celericrescens TaxID=1964542 RepID=A0ABW5B0Q6_9FLAO|nr:hypothetical protein [Aquimarina celericrescens]